MWEYVRKERLYWLSICNISPDVMNPLQITVIRHVWYEAIANVPHHDFVRCEGSRRTYVNMPEFIDKLTMSAKVIRSTNLVGGLSILKQTIIGYQTYL